MQIQGVASMRMDIRSQQSTSSARPEHHTEVSQTRSRAYAISGRGDASSKSVAAAMSFISQQLGVAMNSIKASVSERINQMAALLTSFMTSTGASASSTASLNSPVAAGPAIELRDIKRVSIKSEGVSPTTGGLPIPPTLGTNAQAAIQEWRSLLVESEGASPQKLTREDPGLRTTPLTPNEKKEILAALKASGWNWFAMIKDQSSDKVLIRNTRMIQKEMTDTLKTAINADDHLETKKFSAVGSMDLTSDLDYTIEDGNQAKQVALMNESFRAIFQKEPGIVFDTNFYSAHVVLKEGFQIINPVHEKTWMDSNEVASRVKVALHFTSLNTESKPDTFEGSKFQSDYVAPMISTHIEVALAKAGFTADSPEGQAISARITDTETKSYKEAYLEVAARASAIDTRTNAVKAKVEADIAALSAAPDSPSKAVSLSLLTSKLADPASLEMEAMNIIYAEKMSSLETATTEFKQLETSINDLVLSFSDPKRVSESDIKAWLKAPDTAIDLSLEEKSLLRGVQDQVDEKGLAAIQMQMQTLQYANEPYFAQTTIVGVVKGMQASAGKSADQISQMKKDFPIMSRTEMNTHAMEENFGDLVKDMHHYHENPGDFLTRGAKYLDRMLIFGGRAAEELPGVPAELKAEIKEFKELSGKLLGLRKNGDMLPSEKAKSAIGLVNAHFGGSAPDSGVAGDMAHKLFDKAMKLEMRILAYTEK